jgi:hypothetical protein
MQKKIKKFDTRLENSFFAYQNSFFNLSKLVFRLSKLVFRLSKLVFRLSKLVFRYIYRITNKTNISNNTKIVLASQKRHLGRLTRPNRADAGRISKGKEKNKNTKKDNRAGGGKL